ncbi:Hsp20/alpha crystallin family protein [Symbiobacterium thermophilum]|nr:Hsp20/alpha crystallin family protein [Symbiobacterium thermophilum]
MNGMYRSLLDLMLSPPWPAPDDGSQLTPQWGEDERFLTLRFRTAGLDPKSIRVEVGPTAVSVSGYRTHEERVEARGYFRASSSMSAVRRTFGLPCLVVPGAASVRWRSDDELEVRLQKA